jgi:GDP-mannose 6-dehydrogenase
MKGDAMKIAIFGLGYVGLTGAGCLLKEGHTIIGVEPNEEKARIIASGRTPIYEPGLDDLLNAGLKEGRFSVLQKADETLVDCDLAIVCVGTPSAPDGSHNMTYIAEVSRQIAMVLKEKGGARRLTVVYRSTIRPGSIDMLIAPIFKSILGSANLAKVELVYNPEFLRESMAIKDYFNPPKIVIGTENGEPCATMTELYKNIQAPLFVTGYREAEITKFVDNTFHAVKVTFANEIGRVCMKLGVDPRKVHEIFVADTKLNISPYYLRPGGAFGGSCLPKDVRALNYLSEDVGANNHLVDSLIRSNEAHKRFLFDYCVEGLDKDAKVLLVGLAFKAESDDLRESPQLDLARKLLQAGFALSIYDPTIHPDQLMGQNLGYTYSVLPSLSDLLVSRETAEGETYAVVIDSNGKAGTLTLKYDRMVDVNRL